MNASSLPVPVWLKVFLGIGVVVAAYVISAPFAFREYERQEQRRFDGCKAGQRVDCDSSILWEQRGWSLK